MYRADVDAGNRAIANGKVIASADGATKRQPVAQAINSTLTGFLGKVRVLTSFGAMPIEGLRVNDLIRTTTGRNLKVRRIKRIGLDRDFLFRYPEAQPIRIPMNAFSRGFPMQEMLVSPGQEITVTISGLPPKLIKASDIKGISSVVRAPQDVLIYYTFELSEPAFVYAEGIPVFIPLDTSLTIEEDDDDDE